MDSYYGIVEIVSYQIHSILLLLIIRHPNFISVHSQKLLVESVDIHITPLVVGQLVNQSEDQGQELSKATY